MQIKNSTKNSTLSSTGSHQSLTIVTLVATLQDAWQYKVSVRTGWPSVSKCNRVR